MTPKEKAEELVDKFRKHVNECDNLDAKQCALIAVDEIINLDISHYHLDYWWWQEVQQEINKL